MAYRWAKRNCKRPALQARRRSIERLEQRLLLVGDVTDGLVHHWTFDETSGTTAADSAGDNDATLNNWGPSEAQWEDGRLGGALEFSAPTQFAITDSPVSLDVYTITFWVQISGDSGFNPRIVSTPGGPDVRINNFVALGIGLDAEAGEPHANTPPVPFQWEHYAIALNHTMGEGRVYRNGAQVASGTFATGVPQQPWVFGHIADTTNQAQSLAGRIDDLRVYDRILAASEVQDLFTPPEDLATPFQLSGPRGSLIYESTTESEIETAGQRRQFNAVLDAGQTVTLFADGTGGLRANIELLDPEGVSLGTAIAPNAGGTAVLGPIATPASGAYRILAAGASNTTGAFNLRTILNSDVEREGDNNSLGDAQDIDDSFIDLIGTGASRGAVLGRSDGTPDVVGPDEFGYAAVGVPAEFEDIRATGTPALANVDDDVLALSAEQLAGFDFSFYGQTQSELFVSSNGLVTFDTPHAGFQNSALAASPTEPAIAVLWDDLDTRNNAGELYWEVRGEPEARRLILQWTDVRYFDHNPSESLTFQAVLHQASGTIQLNYSDLDVADPARDGALAATIGVKARGTTDPSRLVIKPSGEASSLLSSGQSILVGRDLLDEAPADHFRFELTEGDSATLLLTGIAEGKAELDVHDPAGDLLTKGVARLRGDVAIHNLVAPVSGDYVVRVAARESDYSLVVTRNSDLEASQNSELDLAQTLPVTGTALGYLNSEAIVAGGPAAASKPPPPTVAADPTKLPNRHRAGLPTKSDGALQASSTADPPSAGAPGDESPQRLIVRFESSLSDSHKTELLSQHKGQLVRDLPLIDGAVIDLSGSGLGVEQAIEMWKTDPAIAYAEPDYLVHKLVTPNDPMFDQLWGMNNTGQTGGTPDADIDAIEAWDIFTGSPNVVVASIDTGVDYNHPDLASNMWVNPGEIAGDGIDNDNNGFIDDVYGIDTANDDADPFDDEGHGTHTAGTFGAVGNNGIGVAGVNWNVQIMALKFLSATGGGFTSDAIDALAYMTMMKTEFGVNVVASNNSWGGGGFSQGLRDAIQASNDAGIMFVAAAGNSSNDNDVSPAYPSSFELDGIIAVAATDHNDELASFSSFGATTVDLAAPGVNTLSTLPGGNYGSLSGTSMATPHVAGAVALLMAYSPESSLAEIKEAVLGGTDPVDALSGVTLTGGRLNAANSFALVADQGDFYQLAVNAGDVLSVETTTPGDDSFEFVNELDPALELYSPSGEQIAADNNGALDGRNARLTFTATETGMHTVRVLSVAGAGEYVVHVTGQTGARPEFQVLATRPTDGERLNAAPASWVVDFDGPLLLTSLDAGDLLIGGMAATGVAVLDGDTAVFDSPPLGEGLHTVGIVAGAVTNVHGTPSQAYVGELFIDATAPKLIESSLSESDVLPPGELTFVARFDEPLLGSQLNADSIELSGTLSGTHSAYAVDYDPQESSFTATFPPLPDDLYSLRLISGVGGFEDLAGNDLDGDGGELPSGDGNAGGDFEIHFVVDAESFDATAFERLEPSGALLFRSVDNHGLIHSEFDEDAVTFFGQAGQTVSTLLTSSDPNASLQVRLLDDTGRLVSQVAAAAGEPAVLPPAGVLRTGLHEIRISADMPTTYDLSVALNFAAEWLDQDGSDELALDDSLTSVRRFAGVGTSQPVRPEVEAVVWGVQPATGQIVAIDPETGEQLNRFAAPDELLPSHRQVGLTVAEDGASLIYLNSDVDSTVLYRLDPLTGSVLSTEIVESRSYDGLAFTRQSTLIYEENLDSDPGWTLEGGWAFGVPLGAAGDPSSGFTGNNVIGYNLAGAYPDNLDVTEFATSPPIDVSQFTDVTLSFHRWLGVESSLFDSATIQASRDGTSWVTLWENPVEGTNDSSWTPQAFDLSAVVAGAATIFIRFGLGPTDSSVTFAGWNLDDIRISGRRANIVLGETGSGVVRRDEVSGQLSDLLTGVAPTGGVGGDDVGRIFVAMEGNEIWEIDPNVPGTVLGTIPSPAADVEGLAFDGATLYASTGTGRLYSLDPSTGQVLSTFELSAGGLFGLAAIATGDRILFEESFDGPTSSFSFDNSFGIGSGQWHLTTGRQLDGLPNHSPPQSIYFGRGEKDLGGGGYDNSVSGAAISSVIDLPSGAEITLSFNTLTSAEPFFEELEVLVDDGNARIPVLSTTPGTLPSSTGGAWRRISADLSAFAGQSVQLVFTFFADGSVNDFEGWYVDDVVVAIEGKSFDFTVPDVDEYTVELSAGRLADILVTGQKTADFSTARLEVLDSNANLLATASVPSSANARGNFDLGILDVVIPEDGVYTVRLLSSTAGEYGVVVLDSLVFNREPDNLPESPLRRLTSGTQALGFVGQASLGARLFAVERPANASDPGTIHELDPQSGQILNSFSTPDAPGTSAFGINLALDGESLWYNPGAPFGDNRIYQLDPDTGTVLAQSDLPGAPLFVGLARVDDRLYAVDGEIYVYDASEAPYQLVQRMPSPSLLSFGLAGDHESGTLYAVAPGLFGSGVLFELDAQTGTVLRSAPIESDFLEQGLAVVGDELFVSEAGGAGQNQVAVYDQESLSLQRRMSIAVADGALLGGLGGDGFSGEGSDFYSVELSAGERIVIYTDTPFDDAGGSPFNALDPALALFDPSGTPLISAAGGRPDGKNALLDYTAPADGVYRVEVSSEEGVGEYILVVDDEVVTGPEVTLTVDNPTVAEDGGTATFTATLSEVAALPVTIELAMSGTASLADYTASDTQIVIAVGSTTGSIVVTSTQDDIDEPDESVIVDVTSVTGGREVGVQQQTTTIVDDDQPPIPDVSLSAEPSEIAEGGGISTITATLSEPTTIPVTVELGLTGTAAPSDYIISATQMVFLPGSTTAAITVAAQQDEVSELDETVIVDVVNVTNGNESGEQQETITILDDDLPPSFRVDSIEPRSSGFRLEFANPLDAGELNLFDTSSAGKGPADVIVTGAVGGPVTGSLVVRESSVEFIKSGDPLPADTYSVVLRSAENGFKNRSGDLLDGDGDGAAGGDYVAEFTIDERPTDARTIHVPDFVRGPGQPVNLPVEAAGGIPISISDGAEVRAVDLRIRYDATLLEITAASAPLGGTVVLNTMTPGLAILVYFNSNPLPPGENTFVTLEAVVPSGNASQIYAQQQVLDIHEVTVGDGSDNEFPVVVDDALHSTTYFADVSANGRINAADAAQVARFAALLDSGFSGSLVTDPTILGDISGNGRINAADAALVARFAALIPVQQIPDLPGGVLIAGVPNSALPQFDEPRRAIADAAAGWGSGRREDRLEEWNLDVPDSWPRATAPEHRVGDDLVDAALTAEESIFTSLEEVIGELAGE